MTDFHGMAQERPGRQGRSRRLATFAVVTSAACFLVGGTGVAAVIQGDDGANTIIGGPGGDSLYGRGGDDILDGRDGNDDLDGGPGADDLHGGPGVDAAVYDGTAPVRVSLDDRVPDGAEGEGDNVHADVEAVYGGAGDDTLIGNRRANTLDGGGGADRLVGGAGVDGLYGGSGNDAIDARDGAQDVVDCGSGRRDVADVDPIDVVRNCEVRGALPRPGFAIVTVRGGFSTEGEPRRKACRGRVRIRVVRGRKRLASATVRVDSHCNYRKTFRLRESAVAGTAYVTFVARFLGNSVLGATTFAPRRARVTHPG